jgi:hypothetical protein
MTETEKDELKLRRKAIRLTLKGLRPCEILKQIARSRAWLFKWQRRFEAESWEGLKSQSRQPRSSPQAYVARARTIVSRVRRSLERRRVGLIGPLAVQEEIERHRLLKPVPSLTTIYLWLKQEGLISRPPPVPEKVYYPQPGWGEGAVLHAMDWAARYLTGGEKLYAFHSVDAETQVLQQTLCGDKTGASVRRHVLAAWQKIGLPQRLQLDNDAAFTGGEKTPRRFGEFVRLCLYLGIELIFLPPGEPKRNWLVEDLNRLWSKSFWKRTRFRSAAEAHRKSPQFTDWYAHVYRPKALSGETPAQAQRRAPRQRLTRAQIKALPEELPITAGRLHFMRRVSPEGEISFLGERWKVGKSLAHQYVQATVITHCRRLEIYHQRSENASWRLVKTFDYEISETVCRLHPEFRR